MPSRSKYLVALAALAAAFAALLPSTAAAGDRSILTAVNPI